MADSGELTVTEHELEAVDDGELEADDDTEAPWTIIAPPVISEPKITQSVSVPRYRMGGERPPEFQRHYVFDSAS